MGPHAGFSTTSRLGLLYLFQIADQQQAAVEGDTRALKIDLQKSIERELKRLVFFVTQPLRSVPGSGKSTVYIEKSGRFLFAHPALKIPRARFL